MFVMRCITDIQNTGSESMHSRDRNVGSEGVSMCHCTVGMIKTNTLNLRTPICTVACKMFLRIRIFAFLNAWSNYWTEDFFLSGRYLIPMRSEIRLTFLFCSYYKNKASFRNFLWGPFQDSAMFFGVRGFSGMWTSIYEITGLTSSHMEQISSSSVLW